jgi:hypothetical protein
MVRARDLDAGQERRVGLRMSRVSLLMVAAFVVCCAAAWFCAVAWTAPVALEWHALHGNYATFEGQRVRVPWDMWADSSRDEELTLTRQMAAEPLMSAPSGTIFISRNPTVLPIVMADQYGHLKQENEQPPVGYRFEGQHQFEGAHGVGYCWEMDSFVGAYVSIACAFGGDTLDASFVGSLAYRERFYAIVAQVAGVK